MYKSDTVVNTSINNNVQKSKIFQASIVPLNLTNKSTSISNDTPRSASMDNIKPSSFDKDKEYFKSTPSESHLTNSGSRPSIPSREWVFMNFI